MREVLYDLRTIKQQGNELEQFYRKRLNNAIHICGNFHGEEKKITLYIDGIS